MNKILIALIGAVLLISCNGKPPAKTNKGKSITDSIQDRRMIDSQMAVGDRPDSEQEGPSFQEVKADLLSSYNKIEHIDTLVVIGNDSLHVHEKYYCLHDSALIVPKKYNWGEKNAKDFVTHNFASNILIIKNSDTIINKTFKTSNFNSAIFDEEKHYAILFSPGFNGYSKLYDGIVFGYSISIPLTDVGVAAYLVIDKKGNYKVVNDYDMINKIKR
jgi:hypothetical protein